jgi:HNH endonuclease
VGTAILRLSDKRSVKVPVKCGDLLLFALVDPEDAERLGERRLSLGSHGYAQMHELAGDGSEAKTTILLHRWVMGARRRDGRIVDHINGIRLDCRKVNLRFVTAAESSANVRARGVSGFRGADGRPRASRMVGSTTSARTAHPRKPPGWRTYGALSTCLATPAGTSPPDQQREAPVPAGEPGRGTRRRKPGQE